jgi:hypothetical protein
MKMLALLKCWRFTKMLTLDENVSTIKMLALYQDVGALRKCWRTLELSALYQNVGTI